MKPNRAPNTSWMMRTPGTYPNGYVRTLPGDRIQISYYDHQHHPQTIMLDRQDARLLAKRVNQCLDETVKK